MRHGNSQQMVLAFIEQYQDENQRPPTIREIQDHCGFKSPRAVSYILEKLEAGAADHPQAHSRGVQLTKPSASSPGVQLPLFASIPAGMPINSTAAKRRKRSALFPPRLGFRIPAGLCRARARRQHD